MLILIQSAAGSRDSVGGGIAEESVPFGEEGDSGSDFFMIVAHDRSQERDEFTHFVGILLADNLVTQLTN
ncbi:MAG: hypothetical protein WCB11_23350 [Terriglobales bacterium]|jgi:hypothetical protein